MNVIGAGYGRTGTDSLRDALAMLLGAPCYHMKELVARPDHQRIWAEFGERGRQNMDWRSLFHGYAATVDWPAAPFWRELMAAFPEAKVVLSVRDPDRWFDSFQEIVRLTEWVNAVRLVPLAGRLTRVWRHTTFHEFDNPRNREQSIRAFNAHTEAVRNTVPPERLLVFRVEEGWEPLCRFLDLPVPTTPFPHSNRAGEISRYALQVATAEVMPRFLLRKNADLAPRLRPPR